MRSGLCLIGSALEKEQRIIAGSSQQPLYQIMQFQTYSVLMFST